MKDKLYLGWSKDPGPSNGGEFPRFFFIFGLSLMAAKILSIFIDESGDFGKFESHCPFYLVTMILHDQSHDINELVSKFDEHLCNAGFPIHAVHSGPLIRRESDLYINLEREERRYLFNALFNFARKLDFQFLCIQMKKSPENDRIQFTSKLSNAIATKIHRNPIKI